MRELEITAVGDSSGVVMTEEEPAHVDVKDGDTPFLTKAGDGSVSPTRHGPDFVRKTPLADEIMYENDDLLRALAK